MIELIAVSKNIGRKNLLNNINLKINSGDRIGIIGPVSSGKTTLLRVILGIYKTSNGIVTRKVKKVGFMPSNKGLYEELTVKDNIKAYTGLKIDNNRKIIDISKEIGVFDYINTRVSDLPNDIKQKASLLVSLSNNPELLVLDEPMKKLDIETKKFMTNFLKEYIEDKTLIVTSNNLDDIEEFCNRIIFIQNGEIENKDSVQSLRIKFSEEKVKILFSEKIRLEEKELIKGNFASVIIDENYILFNEEKVDLNLILNMIIRLGLRIFEIKRETKILQDICFDIWKGDLKSEAIIE